MHGSGAENREYVLPFARFLIRHGMAVLGYDKRGVADRRATGTRPRSTIWRATSVAAFEYLKTRSDIDRSQIGLLGVSQAGWIMPLAAVRAKDIAFLISISGAGVPGGRDDNRSGAERDDDDRHAAADRRRDRRPPEAAVPVRAYGPGMGRVRRDARNGRVANMGAAPDTIPGTPDHPYWQFIRRLYFYDPAPTLRQLKTATLALWGELDNNILADKNKAAWDAALKAAGNRDYTLVVSRRRTTTCSRRKSEATRR